MTSTVITSMETLSLEGKGLKLTSKEDVQPFLNEIEEKAHIKKLVTSGNTFGVEAATALADALATQSSLVYVDISDSFTGRLKDEVPQALTALCAAFAKHPNIMFLNVSDNALGPPGAKAMSSYLSQAVNLKDLLMNNNGLGWLGGRAIADALVSLADNCKNASTDTNNLGLRSALFGRNRLENEGATELAKAWSAHASTLEKLHMPQNGIRSKGIVALSESLFKSCNLTSIDLQDNTFVAEGSVAFARSLPEWPKLAFLNLNDAYLTSKGCQAVFNALGKSRCIDSLAYLLLQYNGMNEDALAKLVSIIPSMRFLKSLQLNGNCFDPSGAMAEQLMDALNRAALSDVLDSLSDMDDEEDDESEQSSDAEVSSLDDSSAELEKAEEGLDDSLVDAFANLAKDMSSALPPDLD